MLLVGLDVATKPEKFGVAVGKWHAGSGRLSVARAGLLCDQNDWISSIGNDLRGGLPALVAVDAPLGWPGDMGAALRAHRAGEVIGVRPDAMFRRRTDEAVRRLTGRRTLDVGADRIARTAHTALGYINRLRRETGLALSLAWRSTDILEPSVIEVYPAGTLRARGLPCQGYKGTEGAVVRAEIAAGLASVCPELREHVARSDHVFDACLCLLAAADFVEGSAVGPEPEQEASAAQEGWIWIRRPD